MGGEAAPGEGGGKSRGELRVLPEDRPDIGAPCRGPGEKGDEGVSDVYGLWIELG